MRAYAYRSATPRFVGTVMVVLLAVVGPMVMVGMGVVEGSSGGGTGF